MRQYISSKVQGLELEFVGDLGEATAKYKGKEIGSAGLYDISTYFANNDDKSFYNIAYDKISESKVNDTLAFLSNTKLI